jgi:hypothetical protein
MDGTDFACSFLLRLEDNRLVAVSTAHALSPQARENPAVLLSSNNVGMAALSGPIKRGSPFRQDHFTMDYVLWKVEEVIDPGSILQPDPRGAGQPGESILVYSRLDNGAGESLSFPGVIMAVTPEATWIQLEASFNPRGFSGCPVVSQHTGQVIGMAVSGRDLHPVVMGLHPIGSIVEKAEQALSEN